MDVYRSLTAFIPCTFYATTTTRAQKLTHPSGDVILIVGIDPDDCGQHTCCGQQVQLKLVLHVCKEQIHTLQGEETAMCCYIMKDGTDSAVLNF